MAYESTPYNLSDASSSAEQSERSHQSCVLRWRRQFTIVGCFVFDRDIASVPSRA
jgi:hypothetical protein